MIASMQSSYPKAPVFGRVDSLIGRCRLLKFIGAGGFGEVWRAQEEIEGQPVGPPCALKLMRLGALGAGSSGDKSLTAGWVQEINALKSISHDAIPRTLDGGIDESTGLAFIAMELLEGETLAQRSSRRRLGWRRALMIAERIAGALDAAHARGVVHRDLKPQNVFLLRDGRISVIDWGIATLGGQPDVTTGLPARRADHLVDASGTQDISTEEQRELAIKNRTPARIVGTPGYIAPEVYEGASPTAPVDAYALGVVLYQCITGQLPYRIQDKTDETAPAQSVSIGPQAVPYPNAQRALPAAIWRAAIDGDLIPIEELVPDLPKGVRALVERLLSRSPAERGVGKLASLLAHTSVFPSGVPDPPYAGLDAFGADRAGFLFGRDAHVDRIVGRLAKERVLVLSGPSGCGKSSLAVAGVASRLDRTMLAGTDGWRSLVVRPSEPRALQIASSGDASSPDWQETLLGTVVVVDQLEEVLELEGKRRDAFCRAMAALAEGSADVMVRGQRITPDAPMRLVTTVREDFEWQVARIGMLRSLLETSRCLVTGVDATSARDLVEEPAKALGYRLGRGQNVVREVEALLATDPTALPIVQFALTEWWVRRDEAKKELSAEAWNELGGVEGALSHVADRYYRELSDADQRLLRELFGRLLLGDRKRWVNAAVLRSDKQRRLMEQLVEHRLVRRRDDGAGLVGYELSHESLARRWDILKQWISERAAEDALLADLEMEAKLWDRQGRPSDRLRPKLESAAIPGDRLGPEALHYVNASVEAGRAAAAAAQGERRRRFMIVMAGLVVILVAVIVYAVQISAAQKKTQEALDVAREQTTEAKTQKQAAEGAKKEAEEAGQREKAAKEAAQLERNQRKADYDALEKKIAEAKSTRELEQIRKEVALKRGTVVPTTRPTTTGDIANPGNVEVP